MAAKYYDLVDESNSGGSSSRTDHFEQYVRLATNRLSTSQRHVWEYASVLYQAYEWQAAADAFRSLAAELDGRNRKRKMKPANPHKYSEASHEGRTKKKHAKSKSKSKRDKHGRKAGSSSSEDSAKQKRGTKGRQKLFEDESSANLEAATLCFVNSSMIVARLGDYDSAVTDLTIAANLDERLPLLPFLLALVEFERAKLSSTEYYLQRCLRLLGAWDDPGSGVNPQQVDCFTSAACHEGDSISLFHLDALLAYTNLQTVQTVRSASQRLSPPFDGALLRPMGVPAEFLIQLPATASGAPPETAVSKMSHHSRLPSHLSQHAPFVPPKPSDYEFPHGLAGTLASDRDDTVARWKQRKHHSNAILVALAAEDKPTLRQSTRGISRSNLDKRLPSVRDPRTKELPAVQENLRMGVLGSNPYAEQPAGKNGGVRKTRFEEPPSHEGGSDKYKDAKDLPGSRGSDFVEAKAEYGDVRELANCIRIYAPENMNGPMLNDNEIDVGTEQFDKPELVRYENDRGHARNLSDEKFDLEDILDFYDPELDSSLLRLLPPPPLRRSDFVDRPPIIPDTSPATTSISSSPITTLSTTEIDQTSQTQYPRSSVQHTSSAELLPAEKISNDRLLLRGLGISPAFSTSCSSFAWSPSTPGDGEAFMTPALLPATAFGVPPKSSVPGKGDGQFGKKKGDVDDEIVDRIRYLRFEE